MMKLVRFLGLLLVIAHAAAVNAQAGEPETNAAPQAGVPYVAGEFSRIFHAGQVPGWYKGMRSIDRGAAFERLDRESGEWYVNDHCLVRGADGRWHLFGIIGPKPPNPLRNELQFFHAVGDSPLAAGWDELPYALVADPASERSIWAPAVWPVDATTPAGPTNGGLAEGESAMLYAAMPRDHSWGRANRGKMQLALSRDGDMVEWSRHEANPVYLAPGDGRDPYIFRHDGRFLVYTTRTVNEADQRSAVGVRTSPDLRHFSGPRIAHVQPYAAANAGDAESPVVIERGGWYYLFVCRAASAYRLTSVYASRDPLSFPIEGHVADLAVHAAEVVRLEGDRWVITDCGWDLDGVYAAELGWTDGEEDR